MRERRCIFEAFDFASFEAAILELSLELFAGVIDDDMSDLYVQIIFEAAQSGIKVDRGLVGDQRSGKESSGAKTDFD